MCYPTRCDWAPDDFLPALTRQMQRHADWYRSTCEERAPDPDAVAGGAGDAGRLARAVRDGALSPGAEGALLTSALRFEGSGRLDLLDALAVDAATPRVRERARVALLTAAR